MLVFCRLRKHILGEGDFSALDLAPTPLPQAEDESSSARKPLPLASPFPTPKSRASGFLMQPFFCGADRNGTGSVEYMFRGDKVKQTDMFILGILFGLLLFWQGYRWWRSFRLQKKVRRAKKGEKQALDLLESEGYEIVELQKRAPICAKVDGVACKTYIAADALVRKDGHVYVAEIKTGSEATKVSHAPTRRQLLEYFFIFKPYGILLVNMEQKKICKVEFSLAAKDQGSKSGVCILLWFMVGIIFGWLLKGGF